MRFRNWRIKIWRRNLDLEFAMTNQLELFFHFPPQLTLRQFSIEQFTSRSRDRAKGGIYARAGIREHWIVNISEPCVERFELNNATAEYKRTVIPADGENS